MFAAAMILHKNESLKIRGLVESLDNPLNPPRVGPVVFSPILLDLISSQPMLEVIEETPAAASPARVYQTSRRFFGRDKESLKE